ncbi:hypothetical protein NC653_033814 [Populus alba x Populus x berolinensis]|uniref:FAR1 domain-containing protein n=1 Tax=Populus alba x Populus x berolinensis TaxID=444605 RepID=A0AAD6LUQ6_9ROSI|nr:hypothetical protein NC653_033814 [Populus alba x Populus x berolinensis]
MDLDKGVVDTSTCRVEEEETVGDGIAEPDVGMEFESEDAARRFYTEYARRVGFVVRVMQRRRSGIDGRTLARRLGCNKQGFSPNHRTDVGPDKKPRPSARDGCKATILVKMEKSGKWVVTRFEKDHNHPLVVTTSGFSSSVSISTLNPLLLCLFIELESIQQSFSSAGLGLVVSPTLRWVKQPKVFHQCCLSETTIAIISGIYILQYKLEMGFAVLTSFVFLSHMNLAPPQNVKGDKDKKIEELTQELEHQEQLCATYREKLLSFMNNVVEEAEELASKIQVIVDSVRKVEWEVQKFSRHG